ncbi:MAG: hypothetical protein RIC55_24935 [Pirellulaceae bacterium]
MRFVCLWALLYVSLVSFPVAASERDAQVLVKRVVGAAGGADKLLKLFRIEERLTVGSAPKEDGKIRVSVLEPPEYWWLGKRQRDAEEPARYLAWAWTLGALTDPDSQIAVLPEMEEAGKPAFGLRVSGTISPPMDLYFDKNESRLVRIDWKSSIHRVSDWKQHDGVRYPAKCVGYKKKNNQPWYFSEIVELRRLTELPEGLKR